VNEESRVRESIAAILAAQRSIVHSMFQSSMPDWIQLDLTMGQLRTLMALAADAPMTVSQLADKLAISKPTASILIDRLVQAGDADRTEDQGDRRRTLVALTSAGVALVARLREGKSDRYERWLAAMPSEDLAALRQGMQALAAIAESSDPRGLAAPQDSSAPSGPSASDFRAMEERQ
jgi:DNA-binding MarR family transcriptional regulator